MVTSNISASRTQVFAVAGPETLARLVDSGLWTVDLTGNGRLDGRKHRLQNLFTVDYQNGNGPVSREPLCDAAITSSAIPAFFPPVPWSLRACEGDLYLRHLFVDGGIPG